MVITNSEDRLRVCCWLATETQESESLGGSQHSRHIMRLKTDDMRSKIYNVPNTSSVPDLSDDK